MNKANGPDSAKEDVSSIPASKSISNSKSTGIAGACVLSQGAEAVIYKKDDTVIKHRLKKSYRHPEIDLRLRKYRTRREAKIMKKLSGLGVLSPEIIASCEKDMKISMGFIEGERLRDVLYKDHMRYADEVGRMIGKLHKNDIVHSDLTTSNMIVCNKTGRIHLIDFGLSFFSTKEEDKAVDLNLMSRALESKHYKIFESCLKAVLGGYKSEYEDADKVLERLKKVGQRGRNKGK